MNSQGDRVISRHAYPYYEPKHHPVTASCILCIIDTRQQPVLDPDQDLKLCNMSSSSHSATISTASHKPACYMGETANNLLTRGRINLYPSPKEYTQYKHLLEELLTEEFGSEHFEVEVRAHERQNLSTKTAIPCQLNVTMVQLGMCHCAHAIITLTDSRRAEKTRLARSFS
jgi:hypothetical protein